MRLYIFQDWPELFYTSRYLPSWSVNQACAPFYAHWLETRSWQFAQATHSWQSAQASCSWQFAPASCSWQFAQASCSWQIAQTTCLMKHWLWQSVTSHMQRSNGAKHRLCTVRSNDGIIIGTGAFSGSCLQAQEAFAVTLADACTFTQCCLEAADSGFQSLTARQNLKLVCWPRTLGFSEEAMIIVDACPCSGTQQAA